MRFTEWLRLRRAQAEDGTKLRSFRLPNQLSKRLDDRARFEGKTVTDVVVKALENLLSVPSASVEESKVMGLSRQVKELELEVERLESEPNYTDAKENIQIIEAEESIDGRSGTVRWVRGDSQELASREIATHVIYYYLKDGKRWRSTLTAGEYEKLNAERPVYIAIIADYDQRIVGLKDKIEALKAEIVKSGVSN